MHNFSVSQNCQGFQKGFHRIYVSKEHKSSINKKLSFVPLSGFCGSNLFDQGVYDHGVYLNGMVNHSLQESIQSQKGIKESLMMMISELQTHPRDL